jgi:Ca2+-binding RTX toxin-like protein
MPVAVSPEIVIVDAASIDEPRVAAKSDRFVVVWERLSAPDQTDLFSAAYGRTGGRIAGPSAIDEAAGSAQSFDPSVAVDRGGTFVAGFWSIGVFPESGARYRSLGANGTPAGAISTLSPDFNAFYGEVINSGADTVMAGLGTGRFLAVWSDTDGEGSTTQALRMRVLGSTPVAETSLDTDGANTNTLGDHTAATGLSNGGFAVAWRRPTGPGTAANVLQLHSATGGKVGPRVTLPRVYAFTGDNVTFGRLAPMPDGGVLYAWRERVTNVYGANTMWDTFVQRYSAAGAAVGKPVQVNDTLETQTQAEDNVALATVPDGRAVVVWTESRVRDTLAKSRDVVMAQVLSRTGEPVGLNIEIDSQPAFGSLSRVDVAALGDDRFVVTWRADTGKGTFRVLARLFDIDDAGVKRSGNDKANTIAGTAGADVLTGKGGADKLKGAGGDDVLDGGPGGDTLDGGPGGDTVRFAKAVRMSLSSAKGATGEAAGDRYKSVEHVLGSPKNDRIGGTGEFNVLNGAAGNDQIDGGPRADRVVGGKGRDTFVYDSHADIPDILPDFVSGQDRLSFENNGFTAFPLKLSPGFAQGASLPANSAATKDSFFFHTGLRRLYYDIGTWIEFARMPNTPSLKRSDIEVK